MPLQSVNSEAWSSPPLDPRGAVSRKQLFSIFLPRGRSTAGRRTLGTARHQSRGARRRCYTGGPCLAPSPVPQYSAASQDRELDPLAAAFTAENARLRRTIQLKLDSRLLSRIDPDDVLQESFLVARRRFDPQHPPPVDSLFVWLRTIVVQTTVEAARRHLGAAMRSAQHEVPFEVRADTAAVLQDGFLGRLTSPTAAAVRQEIGERLAAAIGAMSELDREILLLRHFEELSNGEAAMVLGIHKAAATNRYLRALRRLREVLPADLGGAS